MAVAGQQAQEIQEVLEAALVQDHKEVQRTEELLHKDRVEVELDLETEAVTEMIVQTVQGPSHEEVEVEVVPEAQELMDLLLLRQVQVQLAVLDNHFQLPVRQFFMAAVAAALAGQPLMVDSVVLAVEVEEER